MKRRIILMGGKTHVISLPSQWIKSMNISKGQEIDITEDDTKLIIGTDSIPKRKSITLKDSNEQSILNAYQLGYDEIKILESRNQRHLSEFVSNNLLGFEITSAEPTYTIIKSVSDVNPQEINSMVSRALLLLSNIITKEDSYKRQSALKLIYASKRAISKFGQCNYNKSLILFSLLSELEVSEDTKKIRSSYESFQKYDASKLHSEELALAFC